MVHGKKWERLTGIGDLGSLFRLEEIPLLTSSCFVERYDGHRIDKVDEGVADVAVVGKVNSQVHEVVLAMGGFIKNSLQGCLVDSVGDVSKHDCGSNVLTISDLVDVNNIVGTSRR